MPEPIVECVPNISEGRDEEKINRIVDLARIDGVKILGIEPDPDYNRTVITFAGSMNEVEQAAIRLIRKAIEEIDMRKHSGEHPRMGCVDVCPFIPISNSTMDDCVHIAQRVAEEIAHLDVPVFLYGFSCQCVNHDDYYQHYEKENMKDWKRGLQTIHLSTEMTLGYPI